MPFTTPFTTPFGGPTSANIQDFAFNPLTAPAMGQMLGYVEPVASEEELALRIYLFLIEGIRIEDQQNGALFVKRYLEGPQLVWGQIQQSIFGLKTLWNISEIADEYLKFMKHIVGWTSDLDNITEALDADTLRRLIASSVALWKERGTEDALSNVVSLVVSARSRIWNWFDFRWIMDETGTGHEHDGRDPWTISIEDDVTFNFRIVDDGTLNRQLVRDLANLMRPMNERVEITYLKFLDLFSVAGDTSQWELALGTGDLDVANGRATLAPVSGAHVAFKAIAPVATPWDSYVVTARVRGSGEWGVVFGFQDELNYFRAVFTPGAMTGAMVAGGVEFTTAPFPLPVFEDVWYSIRVQYVVDHIAAKSVGHIYVDGVLIVSIDEGGPFVGPPGIICSLAGSVEADEVEALALPAESDLVDINS
ncbi:MAG: phage tail protein [Acidimicrobiia bacterium]